MKRLASAFAAFGLAACAQAMPPPAAPAMEGRWAVVAVNGRPVAGSAEFNPPRLRFDFGCNDGRGTYRQDGEMLVVNAGLAVTERGCMNLDGGPSDAMRHEGEGFRIASRTMSIAFYGPDRVRLSNEAGTIDLSR